MERASKRAHSRQLDRAWELVDLVVTLALGLTAAYAIATGRANGATVGGGCGRSQGSLEELKSPPGSVRLPSTQTFLRPRAPDRNLVLSAVSLLCSVNDAVNVLPCSTWSYLNGGPFLTWAAFPGRRRLSGRHQTTDLAVYPVLPSGVVRPVQGQRRGSPVRDAAQP
jgi:hypothetical protein